MSTQTLRVASQRDSLLGRLHALLAVQSLVIVLLSINRLTTLTLGYVASNEYLRWYDVNNMLILPLVSIVASYLLKKQLETNALAVPARWALLLNVTLVAGIYLLGAGYGDHEVTNYLHTRFCTPDDGSDLCRIIIFNDDSFSHYVFYAGFILINAALMLFQVAFPHPGALSRRDKILLVINGLFIAAGLFANLAFEEIGIDLYIVALLAALALWLLWRRGAQPMFVYYSTAFTVSLVATIIVQAVRG